MGVHPRDTGDMHEIVNKSIDRKHEQAVLMTLPVGLPFGMGTGSVTITSCILHYTLQEKKL